MKIKLLTVLALVFLGSNIYSQCVTDTTKIYKFTFEGKKYEVVKELKTWANASLCAVERGGYLVEIGSSAEQAAVYNAIITGAGVSPTYISISNGGGIAYVWIGATDQATEGTWKWDGNNDGTGINFWNGQGANGSGNGAAVNNAFINWGGKSTGTPNEPDNFGAGQSHGAISLAGWPAGTTMLGIAGEWNDIIGTSSLYYVIEYNSNVDVLNFNNNINYKIYPNPSKNILKIETSQNIKSIEMHTILGKKVYQNNDVRNNIEIDLSLLESGVYFININDGEKRYSEKIVVE